MNKALVIIDMQKGFINNNTKSLKPMILKFIKENRNKFNTVVATKYFNHIDSPCYKFENWKECMLGSDDVELIEGLESLVDKVFFKDVYSCYNQEFRDYLKEAKIDKVYFIGVNTGCCVLHSVFDCYNDLVDCAVIEDLCGSTSGIDSHNAAIKILKECITKDRVINSSDF